MFDFLNENKRQFLLNHPVLGRISSSPQAISSFIDNLSEFESDLCSPLSKDGQKPKEMIFTKNEIERIKSYIQKVFSKEILELSNKIFQQAGFELWVHAGFREDLNDWMKGEKYYIRGFHNFYESVYEQHLKAPEDIMGVPLNLLLSSRIAEQFNISPETPRHASVGKITFPLFHEHYNLEEIFRWEDFEMDDLGHSSVILRRLNPLLIYPFYLRCAIFCLDQKWDIMRTQVGMKKKKIIERGFLGLKRVREIDEPVISSQRVFKGGSFLPLNQIVNTNSNNPAYLLQFLLPKILNDGNNRPAPYPVISLVASKTLIEEIISFLLRNPDLYCDLIRGFFPVQKFPNINRNILNAPSLQSKGIIFDNFTDSNRIVIN